MTDNKNYIAEAITAHWGERCPDTEPGCPCCDAWAQFDTIVVARTEPTASELLDKLAEFSAAVGFGAGEPATEIAGHFVSFLAANPVHIERFMRDGHEMVIDGTFTYDQGNLTYRAQDGTIRHPDELRAANAEKKANG